MGFVTYRLTCVNFFTFKGIPLQLDAIEYLFTLARHVSDLYAHLQEQWML